MENEKKAERRLRNPTYQKINICQIKNKKNPSKFKYIFVSVV
jgi:hypothetical protein